MKSWERIILEAKSKKQQELEDRVSELDDMPSSLKKNKDKNKDKKKNKEKSDYTNYLNRQLKFKTKKYEEQKRKELENIRKKAGQKNLEKAKSALKSIKTDTISHKENEASAYQKAVGNVASLAGGLASAGYHGARALMDKKAAEKSAKERKAKQLEKKEQGKPGRRREQTPQSSQASSEMKKLTGGSENKRLVPSTKRLPFASKKIGPSGGAPYQAPSAPDKETGMTLGKRARKNPELKRRLIASRNEEYSDWKNEFLLEHGLILEVGTDEKVKKEKVIDVMKGKNSIEMNPEITEDHKEIASGKKKDDEGYMANVELDQMERAIKALRKKVKKSDTQLPAWVQSKITRAADYIDTASEYLQSEESISEEMDKKKLLKRIILKALENKKKRKNFQLISGIIGEEVELIESKKSKMKCNKPKAEAHGSGETGKSHVVKACEGGKEKLIRFGQLGVKGSPKKKGESKQYAMRRHMFQTRHAKNIAQGKMSAAYWANKVKW